MAAESKLDSSETFADLPPESFWVSRNEEQDWFDRNAIMQRKTSMKLGLHRGSKSFSHRSEVRFNRKTRASVIGLPKANISRAAAAAGNPREIKAGKKWLFRSRSEPGGKSSNVQISEPGSPRVSCTGRVGLKRGDGKKTSFSKFFSSLFRTGSGKHRSRTRENGMVL